MGDLFLKRALVQFKRSFDLGMFFIFLTQNFNLKNEVLENVENLGNNLKTHKNTILVIKKLCILYMV